LNSTKVTIRQTGHHQLLRKIKESGLSLRKVKNGHPLLESEFLNENVSSEFS
jgi:hypothetical protein